MKSIELVISNLVQEQFPEFYEEHGPNLIGFVRAYYEWLEQPGNAVYESRTFLSNHDIDTTVPQFVSHFYQEYLAGLPSNIVANQALVLKHIQDLYKRKGSTEAIQLLFRIVYGIDAVVYNPGTDVLRASDGVWTIPQYIEVEDTVTVPGLVGTQITGSISMATAFVESIVKRRINGGFRYVLYLSQLKGNFEYGELVSNTTSLVNAPQILGSLTTIDITEGGANNSIGDLFSISGSTGIGGTAKVVATVDGTGRVTFTLVDGGTGYSNTSNVLVSNNVLFLSNLNGSGLQLLETVSQNVVSFAYDAPLGNLSLLTAGANVSGLNGANGASGNGYVISITPASNTTGTLLISDGTGGWQNSVQLVLTANHSAANLQATAVANTNRTATVVGSNSIAAGIYNLSNTFLAGGMFSGLTSNTSANVISISTGSGAGFQVGYLSNTETLSLWTDFLSGNNSGNVPYSTLFLDGRNANTITGNGSGTITTHSNTGTVNGFSTSFTTQLNTGGNLYCANGNWIGYINSISNNTILTLAANATTNVTTNTYQFSVGGLGFPLDPSGGANTPLLNMLASNTYTIGTIASLTGISPGSNYNANPFVVVINTQVAPFNKRNYILSISNTNNLFTVGQQLSQAIFSVSANVIISNTHGTFSVGESVIQTGTGATGIVSFSNTTDLQVYNVGGTFVSPNTVVGTVSAAFANVTSASNTGTVSSAEGIITAANSSQLNVQRVTFDVAISPNTNITSSYANGATAGSATVTNVYQDPTSPTMGFNAIVTANVASAVGIASQLQILSSGFGYQNDDSLVLTNNTNPLVIEGTATVEYQGLDTGYWKDTRGFLNSNKYLHDNMYYQEYSYEIQTGISLNVYAAMFQKVMHTSGSAFYGKVIRTSQDDVSYSTPGTTILIH